MADQPSLAGTDSFDLAPGVPTIDVPETMQHEPLPPLRAPRTLGTGGAARSAGDELANDEADGELRRFELGGELGRGGAGRVLSAVDRRLRRDLAIKWLHDESAESRTKFIEEAQITGQLQHPNIIPVYELGADGDGRPFLAMKRVHGRSLAEVIELAHRRTRRRDGRIDGAAASRELRRLLDAFLKVCDAMSYAHSRGVIHRDLKPSNVMIGEFGEVLVVDWGLARPMGSAAAASDSADDVLASVARAPGSRRHTVTADGQRKVISDRRSQPGGEQLTQLGHIKGTPGYMAPEQATARSSQLDEGVDIHALGGILFTILTGQPPVRATSTHELLAAALEHAIPAPATVGPREWVPRELNAVVTTAMARRRRDRYPSVADLKADIERYLDGHTLAAADYNAWQRLTKWAARHKALVLGGAATLFVAVVGAGAVLWTVHLGQLQTLQEQARAENESARAENERRERELAELRERAQRSETEALANQFGKRLRADGELARNEFARRYIAAQMAGIPWGQFMRGLDVRDVEGFLEAYEKLAALHEKYPDQVPLTAEEWFMCGQLRARVGRTDDAMIAFQKALDTNPQAVDAWFSRGNLHYTLGQYEAAGRDFRKALELRPDHPEAHFNMGNALRAQGRDDEAEQEYRRAIELAPGHGPGHGGLAAVLRSRGDLRGALAMADRAVQLMPGDAQAWSARGVIRNELGDHVRALEDHDQAIALDDRTPSFFFNRAQANYQLGRMPQSEADCDRALALDPDYPNARRFRGQVRLYTGNHAGAEADFRRVLELEPDNLDARYQMGAAMLSQNRRDEASREFEAVLARNPDHHPALAGRGTVLLGQGKPAAALVALNRAIELDPGDPHYHYGRSVALVALDRPQEALADLDVAVSVKPDNREYRSQRGAIRQRVGRFPEALADFNHLLSLHPNDAPALKNRAIVHLSMESFEACIADIDRALQTLTDDWQGYMVRGAARARLGQTATARADLDRAERLAPGTNERNQVQQTRRHYLGE